MQETVKAYNQLRADEEKVLLCVGIGYGKMLRIGDTEVFGHEVNAASKLGEDIARSGEIIATQAVVAQAGDIHLAWEKLQQAPTGMGEAFKLKDRLVFLDVITDQTENVFPMVPGGKGLTEMILAEEL